MDTMDKNKKSFEEDDLERYTQVVNIKLSHDETYDETQEFQDSQKPQSWWKKLGSRLTANAEVKGIEPITDEEKHDDSLVNAASMWFSANMVLAAFAVGGLGPMVYGLNFGTSVLTIIFFDIIGLIPVAFFGMFGAVLGLRQMILSRFLVGNVTARIFAVINVISGVGWAVVNTVASAQLLNLISTHGHSCPLWAACIIILGLTLLVTFFGYHFIHTYEKYSWIPNFIIFLVIIARMHRSGNFSNGPWVGGPTTAGNVLSFGSTIFGFASGWTTYAADYTVYMPRSTNRYKIFFSLVFGLSFPLFFTQILGAAVATGGVKNSEWARLYHSNGMGGLAYAVLVPDSLHGFGKFCCVILSLSTVANNVPNMYTNSLSAQAIWSRFAKLPRIAWTLIGTAFAVAIAIPAGYYFDTFLNYFVDSIGYYLAIYIGIAIPEHFVFRKSFNNYDIKSWNDSSRLPVGYAGVAALIIAAFGVALSMAQTYWVGEISRLIGKNGGDIGFEMGASWAFIVYIILRPLELRYIGR